MENYTALLTRRSVRKYKDTPIDIEILKEIVKAGMYAPSPFNTQPWEFVIVTDKELLKSLAKATPFWRMLKRCPAAIIVLTKVQECKGVPDPLFYFEACAAATENIIIAANGNGLSSVWLGLYPTIERMQVVTEVLNIPNELTPFSVIPLGIADEDIPPHNEYHEDKVHYNFYNGSINANGDSGDEEK